MLSRTVQMWSTLPQLNIRRIVQRHCKRVTAGGGSVTHIAYRGQRRHAVRYHSTAASPPSSTSASTSTSSSDDRRSSQLVPAAPREVVGSVLPFGTAPRLNKLLVLPIDKPVVPGLSHDVPLHAYSEGMQATILAAVDRKQAQWVALFYQRTDTDTTAFDEETEVSDADADAAKELKDDDDDEDDDDDAEDGEEDEDHESTADKAASEPRADGAPAPAAEAEANAAAADPHDAASVKLSRRALMNAPVTVDSLYDVGVCAQLRVENNRVKVYAHRRIKLLSLNSSTLPNTTVPAMYARVEHVEEPSKRSLFPSTATATTTSTANGAVTTVTAPTNTDTSSAATSVDETEIAAYMKELSSTMSDLISTTDMQKRSVIVSHRVMNGVDTSHPARQADMFASCARARAVEMQDVLSTIDIKQRLKKVLIILRKELLEAKLATEIYQNVQARFAKQQARHLAKEQKKVLDQMLGGGDKENVEKKYRARLQGKRVPLDVKKVIDEELSKLVSIDADSQEFNITRSYLDWLTVLPWGVMSTENFNILAASTVLDADHYGLDEVKTRILEIVASGSLIGNMPSGKIMCLVGPPGVGKTSIGKSIATALNRKFYRFSVGGMDDVSEIKGHRRTYIGAMPGKIIQSMKMTEVSNPVILIDEIDKLGRGVRGDPASALLEVLDPEQNNSFTDHYLDVPFDLSKVLFICTANSAETISGPLADRMDFINISGYVWKEKLLITQKYLEPVVRQKTGIRPEQLTLTEAAIYHLIRWYCREAGVRSLQKHLEKIYRKAALRLARDPNAENLLITENNISEFVGKPLYTSDRLYAVPPVGVATGIAYTSHGGSTIFIESTVADQKNPMRTRKIGRKKKSDTTITPPQPQSPSAASESPIVEMLDDEDDDSVGGNRGELFCTGQMGDVMKESTAIAYTVAKREYSRIRPQSAWFHTHRVHMHVPSGSIQKDGPSAGITMVVSLLSLSLNTPMQSGVAMTGELSLTGRVLGIGGVREKIMSAKHAQIFTVILPKDNTRDYDELPDFIKADMTVHFVDHINQVLPIAFANNTKLLWNNVSTNLVPTADSTPSIQSSA